MDSMYLECDKTEELKINKIVAIRLLIEFFGQDSNFYNLLLSYHNK